MQIAVIGCGYVADHYAMTLRHHPSLAFAGAFDRDEKNLGIFCERWATRPYASLEAALQDSKVELVLNLTNPRSHYSVTKQCLEAGKHVYSEKPLAMDAWAAKELLEIARQRNLYLSAAPCSLLSETAQTMWKAIKDGAAGKIRLVYANFDDGLIAPKQSPWNWYNSAGIPWPAKDEFEVGCTYEHAGYMLTWLAAFFGPAKVVTSFSSCQISNKGIPVDKMAPDFTVGCIEYADGVVARVTCGLVAARDKSISVYGDDGVISTNNVRNDAGPVYVRTIPSTGFSARLERYLNPFQEWLESVLPAIPWSGNSWLFRHRYPFARKPSGVFVDRNKPVDFCRGPAEMVEAIRQIRPCRLSAELAWHITEIIEALQYPERFSGRRVIESKFDPIQPLPWSQ
ncbi:MAG: Gfo/Idh/MocA family oxidoreductase [Chthoniobacteraceae bacterium]